LTIITIETGRYKSRHSNVIFVLVGGIKQPMALANCILCLAHQRMKINYAVIDAYTHKTLIYCTLKLTRTLFGPALRHHKASGGDSINLFFKEQVPLFASFSSVLVAEYDGSMFALPPSTLEDQESEIHLLPRSDNKWLVQLRRDFTC